MPNSNQPYVFNPMEGPAKGVRGAWPFEMLQLTQVRHGASDNTPVVSRDAVGLKRDFHFRNGASLSVVPIFAANMFGVGTLEMAEVFDRHDMLVALDKHVDVESVVTFLKTHDGRTAVPTVGFGAEDERRLQAIFDGAGDAKPKMIIIDVPNGHMQKMLTTVEKYRKRYKDTVLFAGNVGTGDMARQIINAGADGVKHGIGPGSACTTKLVAGTHTPQFANIREGAESIHPLDGYVIGDGGVRTAGDVVVALAGGADFVMIGGAFGAHDESGEPIYLAQDGSRWMEFMGSSSGAYMMRTKGEIAHYRAPEGELQWLPYKGPVDAEGAFLREVWGGLRSAFSYAGAFDTAEFAEMAKRTYRGEAGGLRLNKAEMSAPGGGKATPKIVGGLANPITGRLPNPTLLPPL